MCGVAMLYCTSLKLKCFFFSFVLNHLLLLLLFYYFFVNGELLTVKKAKTKMYHT